MGLCGLYWHKIPVTNLDLFNGMCLIKPSQISDNEVVYFYKIIQVLYLIQVIRYRIRKKQTKKPRPNCQSVQWHWHCIEWTHSSAVTESVDHWSMLLVLQGSPFTATMLVISLSLFTSWSKTNQAGEETCPTAIHVWLAKSRNEAKQNWISFRERLLGWWEADPLRRRRHVELICLLCNWSARVIECIKR